MDKRPHRHVIIDNEPWFVAADVCRALGLTLHKGTFMHLKKLHEDEKRIVKKGSFTLPVSDLGALWCGSENQHSLVSESGLYKLILRSDKQTAKAFQDWVTREVLPAIRKTGGYLLNEDMRVPSGHFQLHRADRGLA